jgi:hypothetical protein
MNTLATLESVLRERLDEWVSLTIRDLQFWHRDEARLALAGLGMLLIVLLAARLAFSSSRQRGVGVPAILQRFRQPHLPILRWSCLPPASRSRCLRLPTPTPHW